MPNPKGINQYSKGGKGAGKSSSRRSAHDRGMDSALKTVQAQRAMASRTAAGSATAGTGKKTSSRRSKADKAFDSHLKTVEAHRRLLGN